MSDGERTALGAILLELLVERMLSTTRELRKVYRIGVKLTADEHIAIIRQLATLEAQGQHLMGQLHRSMSMFVQDHQHQVGGSAETAAGLMNALGAEAHKETAAWLKEQVKTLEGAS